ncbi:YusW family protein [Sporosarcina sp. 179-K 3D1 HS]|uniref:YusW family protein n=1 Tax=Sporosarcina sp. 179-K 3D1 HS TaxID=3232169 RepID=UPI00399F7457
MKKLSKWSSVVACSFLLMACADDKDQAPTVEENQSGVEQSQEESAQANDATQQPAAQSVNETQVQTEASDQEEMQQKMEELQYVEFELEVEYADHMEYEVELEKKKDGSIKAGMEDSLNGVEKEGIGAFNELFPLVKQLTITQQTDKEQAITDTLSIFNLPTDYVKFDLEIRFKDGTKIEFKDIR